MKKYLEKAKATEKELIISTTKEVGETFYRAIIKDYDDIGIAIGNSSRNYITLIPWSQITQIKF